MPGLPLVGIDITSVARVTGLRGRRDEFAAKVFTAAEAAYCEGHDERWAARWAAKEAVRKLAGGADLPLPAWLDIEVTMAAAGAPWAKVKGWAEPVALSLSHDGDTAIAVAALSDPPLPTASVSELVLPNRPAAAHKGTFGRVVVAAGSRGYSGAAYLAAMGAARGGAGLVQLVVPESIYAIVAARCAEIVVVPAPDEDGGFGPALWRWMGDESRASAVVIGCGFGQTPGAQRALVDVTGRFPAPMVVDADGLNAAAARNIDWRRRPGPTVLTPHPAEMARLCNLDVSAVQANRERVASDFAERNNIVVVLKGAGTVIADPEGRIHVDDHDVVALASAGTGDVLAGLVGAMLSQGLEAFDAAVAGVTIHAEAGAAVQRRLGRSGALAGDVVDALPAAQERLRRALEAQA